MIAKSVDLSQSELAILRTILLAHLPKGTHAWVFGSRATGYARRYSGLDLALEWEQPLDHDELGDVADAPSESDLPYKVDLIDLRSIDPPLRATIELTMVALPL
jgi:predicted nucleotidyltransferase